MKAKAPEKIYIPITEGQEIAINEWGSIPLSQYEHKRVVENIEYTRTDVFIKESVQWLSDHVNDYIINDKYILSSGKLSRDWLKVKADMFDDYKKYMEGRL